jgi:hypothetical protein
VAYLGEALPALDSGSYALTSGTLEAGDQLAGSLSFLSTPECSTAKVGVKSNCITNNFTVQKTGANEHVVYTVQVDNPDFTVTLRNPDLTKAVDDPYNLKILNQWDNLTTEEREWLKLYDKQLVEEIESLEAKIKIPTVPTPAPSQGGDAIAPAPSTAHPTHSGISTALTGVNPQLLLVIAFMCLLGAIVVRKRRQALYLQE